MNRPTSFTTPIVSLALFSLVWLSSLAPALAATVTDTFPLTLTGTERCRNDPKFVEPIHVKTKDGATITFTRDVLSTGDLTDIQAKVNNSGNATIDAMTLNGRALLANKAGSIAQVVLSGTDPGNPDHFMTLRGQATFNKAGNLTKVTGTYVYQVLSASGGVPNSDCFGSGTFVTIAAINPQTLSLSIVLAGTGTVTSNPTGLDCPTTCAASFNKGTSVTLTASGTGFGGWSGGGCSGTGTCIVTLDQNTTVTATFGAPPSSSVRYHFFYSSGGPLMAVDPAAPVATPATVAPVVSNAISVYRSTWNAATTSVVSSQPVFEVFASAGKLWRVNVAKSSGVPGHKQSTGTNIQRVRRRAALYV